MRTLNLGILAHVDAGKTSLTERLLYAAGVIDEIGSVDDGSTQTDSLALERQRGITIKSAVVSFVIDDVTVNLIDTPGHPDFIAEVERVLSVLDGAVLVISAVEGVQAQTRVLMRTLQRLRIPTLDLRQQDRPRRRRRTSASCASIAEKLTPRDRRDGRRRDARHRATPTSRRTAPATPAFAARLAELLADHDDALLAAYVDDDATRVVPPAARRARGADAAGAGAPGVLRLGDHRRGRRRADGRHHRVAARGRRATSTARCRAPCSRSSGVRPGRGSRTSACSREPSGRGTGCPSARRRAQGHRDQRVRPRRGSCQRRRSPPARSASSGASATSRSATRSAPRAPHAEDGHHFAPPTLETVDRSRVTTPTRARCTSRSRSSPSRTR